MKPILILLAMSFRGGLRRARLLCATWKGGSETRAYESFADAPANELDGLFDASVFIAIGRNRLDAPRAMVAVVLEDLDCFLRVLAHLAIAFPVQCLDVGGAGELRALSPPLVAQPLLPVVRVEEHPQPFDRFAQAHAVIRHER